jgi:hypothetical protein
MLSVNDSGSFVNHVRSPVRLRLVTPDTRQSRTMGLYMLSALPMGAHAGCCVLGSWNFLLLCSFVVVLLFCDVFLLCGFSIVPPYLAMACIRCRMPATRAATAI